MAKMYKAPSENAVQTTLDGQVSQGATSITLADATGLQAPGIGVIDRVDSNENETPSKREYFSFTGISTNTLTGVSRGLAGSTDQVHSDGAIVEFTPDIVWANAVYDTFNVEHDATDGSHKLISTATISNVFSELVTPDNIYISSATITGFIDDDTMGTATADTVASSESIKAYVDNNAGAGGKYQFIIPGTLTTGTDLAGTWFVPDSITIDEVDLYVDTAGATGTTTIDVNLDGTTIFSTGKPALSDTATSDLSNTPTTTAATEGQKITIDCDAVTTTAPVDTYVIIKYS